MALDRKRPKGPASAGSQITIVNNINTLPDIQRVGKNSTGEAVTCAGCKYRLQVQVFRQRPESLFLVLTCCLHTSESGQIAHGPQADQQAVHKKASFDMRLFIQQEHRAGVPAGRILQGVS